MALSVPAWFSLDAAQIAGDSRLQGHYLNARLSDEGFVAEVDSLIPVACAYVVSKIRPALAPRTFPLDDAQLVLAFPDESALDRAQHLDDQIALACEAVKERAVFGLYRMLTGVDNQAIAEGCKRAADDLIASLIGELKTTLAAIQAGGKPNLAGYGALSMGRFAQTSAQARNAYWNGQLNPNLFALLDDAT